MAEMQIIPASDPAREYADKELEILSMEIEAVYEQAYEEVREKAENYFKWFGKADANMRLQFLRGEITAKEYKDWRVSHMLTGKRWFELADSLATDMTNADMIATSIIGGHMPEVYAVGFNYSTYKIEKQTLFELSFTLYNRQAVERLIRDNPRLLPMPKTDIPKDMRWNRQHLQSAALQGILQGKSPAQIADNLAMTTEMNQRAAMRTARTMLTSAENGGRMDAIKRAEDMGIKSRRIWYATLDGRTRNSHRHMDREIVEGTKKPFSNGCMFPGDPDGRPEEVYNCRCRMDNLVTDVDLTVDLQHNGKLGTMTYEEWKNAKGDEAFFKAARREKYDKDQYYKYRKLKVDGLPNNFRDFQNMKYNDPQTWEQMKVNARNKRTAHNRRVKARANNNQRQQRSSVP